MPCCDPDLIPDPRHDPALTPEVRAMMGIYVTFTQMQICLDAHEDEQDRDMPDNQRHMLVKLDRPRRMGDLAKVMNALPSSLTAIADGLEERGLIMRMRDPDDRRAWLLSLTDEGRAFRSKMLTEGGRLFREVTGLGDDDIHTLADLSDKIRSHILSNMLHKGASQ